MSNKPNAKAGRRLRLGDTVHLGGGTYGDDSLFTTADGTEDAPITVKPYPGQKAVRWLQFGGQLERLRVVGKGKVCG